MMIQDIETIIAQETGCTPAAARKAARAVNFKYRGVFSRSMQDDPAARRDVIIELHKNGATIEELAQQYKLYPATIRNMVKDNG